MTTAERLLLILTAWTAVSIIDSGGKSGGCLSDELWRLINGVIGDDPVLSDRFGVKTPAQPE